MDQFVLSIGPEGVPWSLRFNEAPLVGLGEEGDYSEEKIRPLVLLALYTASIRRKGNGNAKLCPSLKELDIPSAKSLSEAIDNDKLYKASAAKAKETGSKFNSTYWLAAIFGERPSGKFLTGKRHGGDAAFTENVQIIIEDDRDGEVKNDIGIISSLLTDYRHGVSHSRKTVYIALNLEDCGERPETIINTNLCEGSFRNNVKYWIEIETNFQTHFHVFWISPNDASILTPSKKYKSICEESLTGVLPKILKFGEEYKITIAPPTGNHICVLLLNEQKISENICADILTAICDSIPDVYRKKPLKRPELTKHRIADIQQKKRGIIIHTEPRAEVWQDKLARNLAGNGRILYVFAVPHI